MQHRSRLATLVAAVVVVASCTADSSFESSSASSSTSTAPPVSTTAASETALKGMPSVVAVAPSHVEPVAGRWVVSNLGLDGLLVIPRDLVWDEQYFWLMQRVAFGDMRVWRSVDGLTWDEFPSIGRFRMEEGGPEVLLSGGGRLVAGGNRGALATVWVFDDSSSWTEIPVGGDGTITGLAFAGSNLVAFGQTVSPGLLPERHAKLWVSSDGGVSWSEIDDSPFGEFSVAVGVVTFGDRVVVVATRTSTGADGQLTRESPLLLASKDGITWEPLDVDLGEARLWSVTGGDGIRLFARASMFESVDGESWTMVRLDRSGLADVEAGGWLWFDGRVVLTGGVWRTHERFGAVLYPSAWTYAGDGAWHEFGALGTLTEPGLIWNGVSSGDRFVAVGRQATDDSPDDGAVVYTFIAER